MAVYTHVLCATDLSERARALGGHAVELAQRYGAKISFLHVIQERDWGARAEIEKQPHERGVPGLAEAEQGLEALAEDLGVPDADRKVVVAGSVGAQIRHIAEQMGADVIVVGSHGRHGLSLLLGGSTPNDVLHGATCDVLAVYIAR